MTEEKIGGVFFPAGDRGRVWAQVGLSELDFFSESSMMQQLLRPRMSEVDWNYNGQALFLSRQGISHLLYLRFLYDLILPVPGVICEFGVRFGPSLVTMTNLRGALEPFNYTRKVIGFDTFSGFTELTAEEVDLGWSQGDYSTPPDYASFLGKLLELHEQNAPLAHIKKHELVVGDVTNTLDNWLERNPSLLISLAILDLDVQEPTEYVLERIIPRMPRGSVIAFDQLSSPVFPGETRAVEKVLGLNNLSLRRAPTATAQAYWIVD